MKKASEVIFNLFKENNHKLDIETLQGKKHTFTLSVDGTYIESQTALRSQKLGLDCFDIVIELLKSNNGKAHKGNGRGKENKVGEGKCTEDTVCGYISMKYYGHTKGESTFDPVFAISAILEQAGICWNSRGWLEMISA
jgi:hypothetical protein